MQLRHKRAESVCDVAGGTIVCGCKAYVRIVECCIDGEHRIQANPVKRSPRKEILWDSKSKKHPLSIGNFFAQCLRGSLVAELYKRHSKFSVFVQATIMRQLQPR
jgi:hypothetical protein